jgi:anti-sigma regulatory factor (Ser/Thr protein kinase)
MCGEFTISIMNTLSDLKRLTEEANEFIDNYVLSPRTVYAVNLVIEEVVTNILKYAYSDGREHEIIVRVVVQKSEILIECTDDGAEFDPLLVPARDLDKPIHECDPGGMGIHLLRKMAHSVEYCRERGKNLLRVTIKDLAE